MRLRGKGCVRVMPTEEFYGEQDVNPIIPRIF